MYYLSTISVIAQYQPTSINCLYIAAEKRDLALFGERSNDVKQKGVEGKEGGGPKKRKADGALNEIDSCDKASDRTFDSHSELPTEAKEQAKVNPADNAVIRNVVATAPSKTQSLDLESLFRESPLLSDAERVSIGNFFADSSSQIENKTPKKFKLNVVEKSNENNEKVTSTVYIEFHWDANGTLSWRKFAKNKTLKTTDSSNK